MQPETRQAGQGEETIGLHASDMVVMLIGYQTERVKNK